MQQCRLSNPFSHSVTAVQATFSGVEPLGLGSPFVESLTGFLQRVANEHTYPPSLVFVLYLIPHLRAHGYWKCRLSEVLRMHAHSMNGAGKVTDVALAKAKEITGRSDLAQLSTANMRKLNLEERGLLDRRKRWCPECWREDDESNGRYERKLWALSVVEVCPVHRTELVERCFGCGQTQPAVARDVRVGTCANCGRDLCSGATPVAGEGGSDGLRQLWYAKQAALLVLGCDTCSVLGINDEESATARKQAFQNLEQYLLETVGPNHCSVRQVRAWRKGPARCGLEPLFSVLWEARWPVPSLFPLPVRELLEVVHDQFSSVNESA